MLQYSFARFKLGGVFRKHLASITRHLKAGVREITPPVLLDPFMLRKRAGIIVYVYDCSVSWLHVSHLPAGLSAHESAGLMMSGYSQSAHG